LAGRDGEKKTIRQHFLDWWLPVVALVLIVGAGRSFVLWQDRNYGQLTTSLITVLGVVVTLWMTQVRAIEQQEREDKRHHTRLEAEAKMHDERLRAEAQKDRDQRSITQRIDLAEKLASAIDHLSSENELKQAAGVQEILFQIDDWYRLIESEIIGIMGMDRELEIRKNALTQESLRHRQELFDIAYKFDTENLHVLKSRAKGLTQRLRGDSSNSLAEVDFSDIVISDFGDGDFCFSADLRGVVASGIKLFNARMRMADLRNVILTNADFGEADLRGAKFRFATLESVDLRFANLQFADLRYVNLKYAILRKADLESAILRKTNLQFADLRSANLKSAILRKANIKSADFRFANLESVDLRGAFYDDKTLFPEYFDIEAHGMVRDVS